MNYWEMTQKKYYKTRPEAAPGSIGQVTRLDTLINAFHDARLRLKSGKDTTGRKYSASRVSELFREFDDIDDELNELHHGRIVRRAYQQGLPVPQEVLDEYDREWLNTKVSMFSS
jgi:hypothetical protein